MCRLHQGALPIVRGRIPISNAGRCKGNQLPSEQLFSCIQRDLSRYVTHASALTTAGALGLLVDNEKATTSQTSLIQNFNRWLLSTFSAESMVDGETPTVRASEMADLTLEASPSAINQILGIELKTTNTCQKCNHSSSRLATTQAVDLTYTKKSPDLSFPEILRSSISRETATRATCSQCKSFSGLLSRKVLANPTSGLPSVLSVNTMISSAETFDLWKTPGFLPSRLGFSPTVDGELIVDDDGVMYQVRSLVVQIQTEEASHLVSFALGECDDDWANSSRG